MKRAWIILLAVLLCLSMCACSSEKKAEAYEQAVLLQEQGNYQEAMAAFEALKGYEDSDQRLDECRSSVYDEAADLEFYGNWEEALGLFEMLGDYEDSAARAEECKQLGRYLEAEALWFDESYEQALVIYEELGDFENSAERAEECRSGMVYLEACEMMRKGEFAKAERLFNSIADVMDVSWELSCCNDIKEMVRNPLFEEFQERMGMDLLAHEIESAYSDNECVSIIYENSSYLDGEYAVEMADGSVLRMPMTYMELTAAGWQLDTDDTELDAQTMMIPAGEYEWCTFINADGKTLDAEIANGSESEIALADTDISQLEVGDTGTELFCLEGLCKGATVSEIVEVFGLPRDVTYYRWEDAGVFFYLSYVYEENDGSISFYFDPDTGLLDSIDFIT